MVCIACSERLSLTRPYKQKHAITPKHMHWACIASCHDQENRKDDLLDLLDGTAKWHVVNKDRHSGGPWASSEAFHGAEVVVTTLATSAIESESSKLLAMTSQAGIKGAMVQFPVSTLPAWPAKFGVEPDFNDPAKGAALPWLVTQARGTCIFGYQDLPFPGLGRFMCAFSGTVGVIGMDLWADPSPQTTCSIQWHCSLLCRRCLKWILRAGSILA